MVRELQEGEGSERATLIADIDGVVGLRGVRYASEGTASLGNSWPAEYLKCDKDLLFGEWKLGDVLLTGWQAMLGRVRGRGKLMGN